MLVELKKLNIVNEGYRRQISLDKIFVNSSHVVSIRDYHAASEFLLSEGLDRYSNQKFSLVKISTGSDTEEIIVFGSSADVYESFRKSSKKVKKILNG